MIVSRVICRNLNRGMERIVRRDRGRVRRRQRRRPAVTLPEKERIKREEIKILASAP